MASNNVEPSPHTCFIKISRMPEFCCVENVVVIILVIYCGVSLCSQPSVISPTSTRSVLPSSSALSTEKKESKTNLNQTLMKATGTNISRSLGSLCPDNTPCNILGASCIQCNFDDSCVYGSETEVNCAALASIKCTGPRTFVKKFNCRYCYQTQKKDHVCMNRTGCKVMATPLSKYITNCTVSEDILCLGNRTFHKMSECNWTSGYRWSTAVLLSLTLGGFGVDRFYLGHWKEGLGKLFSFGGLGVWTLVDLILIIIGYVGPADGSLYIF